jgi:two-component system LytT family response regulator
MNKPVKIALVNGKETRFVFPDEITHCQSEGNYTVLFRENHEKLMFTKSLKDVCKILPEEYFFRIHHSYVINLSFADRLIENGNEHEVVLTTGINLPVSRRKKADFLARFTKL